MIRLQDIHKSYQMGPVSVEVLKGVNLSIDSGDLLAVLGQSGCGKSTLMNIIGLLDSPDSGSYTLEGKATALMSDSSISEIRNKKIGFVFQQFNLLPKLTALQNVALPLVYRGVPEKYRVHAARETLDRVGMLDRANHKPSELSGGQQQRVAIARALVGNPAIILADEPTGALDEKVGQEIMDLFIRLNEEASIMMFVITHDITIARQCKSFVRMQDGIIHDPRGTGRGII